MRLTLTAMAAAIALATMPAAAEPVRIGMITTLSGGGSALGIDIRDGFELAVKLRGGELGGVPVELTIADDAREPQNATQIAERMLQQDKVQIMTGIVWSNLALAVVPKVVRADVFYISPNAGPSQLAGRQCHPNYFNVAWQNDNLHEAVGQYVQDEGYDNVYLLAPNYPAGKDSIAGFKRFYDGGIAGETYTKLGQLDYAAEIAQIRAAKPDAVFFFLPGGMGINFIKQYDQAGLKSEIPLFGPGFSFDQAILGAVGKAAVGAINSSQWNRDLDNEANRTFVAEFEKAYGRLPSLYASQGYDAARLIDSAIRAVDGDLSDADAFRAALKKAEFDSVRGDFAFGANNHPVQAIYVREVVTDEQGRTVNKVLAKAFESHGDAYADECSM
jgi:branched-chain amino acid transport system substrate-binding protein